MSELKPCPFCGSEAGTNRNIHSAFASSYNVFCTGCYANTGHYSHEKDAIDTWNNRIITRTDRLQQENERLQQENYRLQKQIELYINDFSDLKRENEQLKNGWRLAVDNQNIGNLCEKCCADCIDAGHDMGEPTFQCGCFRWQHGLFQSKKRTDQY